MGRSLIALSVFYQLEALRVLSGSFGTQTAFGNNGLIPLRTIIEKREELRLFVDELDASYPLGRATLEARKEWLNKVGVSTSTNQTDNMPGNRIWD